ncbi:putative cytochrome P450 [Tanacetum coccineum]
MVNTRSNDGGNGTPPTGLLNSDLNGTLTTIQRSIEQISSDVSGLLMFQHFATGELNKLTNREGTSTKGGSGSQYGRLTKFEFPKFSCEYVQRWLYRVNQFFLLDSVAANQKVRLVSMHMFDKALNWHKQFVRKYGEEVDWNVYEREVRKRFDPVFEDPMVDLKNLKQVTSVQLYQEQFEALLNKDV